MTRFIKVATTDELEDDYYLQPGWAPGRYALSLRLAELGHLALEGIELRAKARPALEALMAETRETSQ